MNAYDLQRFAKAQEDTFTIALNELRQGKKRTHWMWFIFPQLRGLGRSETAWFYGIKDISEAESYLKDPILGERLTACCKTLLEGNCRDAITIFGKVDAMKLKSSMTLFSLADPKERVFKEVLDGFFEGCTDQLTVKHVGDMRYGQDMLDCGPSLDDGCVLFSRFMEDGSLSFQG